MTNAQHPNPLVGTKSNSAIVVIQFDGNWEEYFNHIYFHLQKNTDPSTLVEKLWKSQWKYNFLRNFIATV